MRDKFLYVIYFLWPFSSAILFVRYFNYRIAKFLFVGFFAFLGYTSTSSGDLKFYESLFNNSQNLMFSVSHYDKIFNFYSALFLSYFINVKFYFTFMFSFFAYLLISSIKLLQTNKIIFSNLNQSISLLILITTYFTWNLFNYAFFTGGIFFLYFVTKYLKTEKNIFAIAIILTPLFHFSHFILVFLLMLVFFLKDKHFICILILLTSYIINIESVLNLISSIISFDSDVFSYKFDAYASEGGIENANNKFDQSYSQGNGNFKIFHDLRLITFQYLMPLLSLFIFLNMELFKKDIFLKRFFNFSILSLALFIFSLNFSEGFRFGYIYAFSIIGVYFLLSQKVNFSSLKFKALLLTLPIILIFNLIQFYVSMNLSSIKFLITNYFTFIFA